MRSLGSTLGLWRIPILLVACGGALILGVPFLILLASSWTEGAFIQFPAQGFTLKWYATVLQDPEWVDAFWLSVRVAGVSTAIAVVFGVAGALALPRLGRSMARLVRTLFIVPIALPPVAYAVGLYSINNDFLGPLRGSPLVLIMGEALLAMPYVFVVVSGAVGRMDPALRNAAATMGAHWPRILLRVELPLLWPVIAAGALFGFNLVFDEVTLSVFLLPAGQSTLPLQMLSAAQESFSPELTAASTMISVLALVLLGGVGWLIRPGRAPWLKRKVRVVGA